MAEKIKVFVVNELRDIQTLLQDGLRSGAYLYPFRVRILRVILFDLVMCLVLRHR